MNRRLEFSNRTWIIIACVIAALIILIAILKPSSKDGDLTLKSYDGTTSITIEEVVREEADNEGRHIARCKIDRSKDFYRSFVKRNPYFIGSIDSNGYFRDAEENRDTGYYVLLKDDHYFCLICENGYALIKELEATVKLDNETYFMPFPCDVTIDASKSTEFDFISLTTVNSFEGLVSYYERLKGDYCLVDDINKTLTLRLWKDGELTQNKLVISMTETGILIGPEE